MPAPRKSYIYTVRLDYFDADGGEGYTVTVPALPGCVTWGRTVDEAFAIAREAIEGHLLALAEQGQPIPEEDVRTPLQTRVEIQLALPSRFRSNSATLG
jgi:predicted RNase H-like HicB family nuclease